MTAPKTARRPRKPKTSQALMPRTPTIDGLAADFLILSGRLAVTPAPVFWADRELDTRATVAVETGADYDDNYDRALPDYGTRPGEAGKWAWYLSHPWCLDCHRELGWEGEPHEPCDIPVVTLTVVASNGSSDPADPALDDDPVLTARVDELMGVARKRRLLDVPGVDGPPASAPSEGTVPGPVGAPPSASPQIGPGTPDDDGEDDDNALD